MWWWISLWWLYILLASTTINLVLQHTVTHRIPLALTDSKKIRSPFQQMLTCTCDRTHWSVTAHLARQHLPQFPSCHLSWSPWTSLCLRRYQAVPKLSWRCLSTISNSIMPSKVRYLCRHWKSNFTPIKSCNNRISNPVLKTPSFLPTALTTWYNEVSQ